MADSETVSLALTGVFGVVSSLGVLYQIIDIRQRSKASTADAVAGAFPPGPTPGPPTSPAWVPPGGGPPVSVPPAAGPVSVPPAAGPVGWHPAEPPTTRIAQFPSPPVPPPYPLHPSSGAPVYPVPAAPPAPLPGTYTVPAQPPYYPPPARLYGPPPIPGSVVRARICLLLLSLLAAVTVALVIYVSQVEVASDTETSLPMTVVAAAVLILIVATPLSLVPMVMSLLIGRGQNWARVTSIVVLFFQALFCSCFGAFIPFSGAYSGSNATGEHAVVGDILLGVTGILIGVTSVVAAIQLLSRPTVEYFRAMQQWRTVRPQ